MDDKLQSHRQPLVTATGIILGFILNFATSFVKSDTSLSDALAYVVGACILCGVILLIWVMYRALTLNYDTAEARKYYQRTVKIFILGVSIAFTGVMIDMATNFMLP